MFSRGEWLLFFYFFFPHPSGERDADTNEDSYVYTSNGLYELVGGGSSTRPVGTRFSAETKLNGRSLRREESCVVIRYARCVYAASSRFYDPRNCG